MPQGYYNMDPATYQARQQDQGQEMFQNVLRMMMQMKMMKEKRGEREYERGQETLDRKQRESEFKQRQDLDIQEFGLRKDESQATSEYRKRVLEKDPYRQTTDYRFKIKAKLDSGKAKTEAEAIEQIQKEEEARAQRAFDRGNLAKQAETTAGLKKQYISDVARVRRDMANSITSVKSTYAKLIASAGLGTQGKEDRVTFASERDAEIKRIRDDAAAQLTELKSYYDGGITGVAKNPGENTTLPALVQAYLRENPDVTPEEAMRIFNKLHDRNKITSGK